MLAGVHEDLFDAAARELSAQQRRFNKLRACADDAEYAHLCGDPRMTNLEHC